MNSPWRRLHSVWLAGVLIVLWMGVWGSPLPAVAQAEIMASPTPLAPPDAPTLLAPAYGELVNVTNAPPLAMPTLRWSAPLNANIFHFQIADSPGFATILKESDTYSTAYTPTDVWPDSSYYWRVRAGRKEGAKAPVWSAYSDAFVFHKNWSNDPENRPLPVAPEAGAIRSAFTAQDFSWTPVTGAAGYRLEIATDEQFANIVYSAETVKPQHTPTRRFAANAAYYWRVIPFAYFTTTANRVNGTVSPTALFSFAWSTPPRLLDPPAMLNEQKPELRFLPRFSWMAVEGAKEYEIEIGTDQNFGANVTSYTTRNTDFTPTQALSNDQEYFWRVRAANADGYNTAWSEVRSFRMKWNVAPKLLTPANLQTLVSYPYFSWEPVPGAERYKIKITEGAASAKTVGEATVYNVNHFTYPGPWESLGYGTDYYWQVQALDARGNLSPPSQTFSFKMSPSVAPNLIYPLPFYAPDAAGHPVHDNHTVAWPLFVWDTAHASESPINYAAIPDYYEITVATSDAFAPESIVYQAQTRGLAIAPTAANGWAPQNGQSYFWRVRPYWGASTLPTEQVWTMRYDRTTSVYTPTLTITPIYPADGYQAVAAPPVLGWLPYAGAAAYQVQISRRPDAGFDAHIVDEAHALSINYVPWQERLTDMPPGSYWWRVRPEQAPGAPIGEWSAVQRFDLANDLITANIYDLPVLLQEGTTIITDTRIYGFTRQGASAADTGDSTDLGELHAMLARRQDGPATYNLYWVFAFTAAPGAATAVAYDLYVDFDHVAGSGADRDPFGGALAFDMQHRPEFLIHVSRNGSVTADTVTFQRWQNGAWQAAQTFTAIGGKAWFSDAAAAVQLLVPYSALGGADDGLSLSLALALISRADNAAAGIGDSIPTQGSILGNANQLDNFTYISDMLLPLYPFDSPLSSPDHFYEMPVLRWRMPYFDSVDGYLVQVARDAHFTDIVDTWETVETDKAPVFGFLPTAFVAKNAYADNETYYWRVRLRHEIYQPPPLPQTWDYGPWSPPMRFKLSSRLPGNPALSTGAEVFMTPTFLWERVEGASGYMIQIDNDANFSSPIISQAVDGTSYTPQEASSSAALSPGTQYYWRLAMRRSAHSSGITGQWTPTMTFQKSSVSPAPLLPSQGMTITGQPAFAWSAVLTPTATPRLAAPLYTLQVDDDPTFGSPFINVKTAATAYTPVKGQSLADGLWYWRVALTDANNKNGPFSATQSFVKQYTVPNLVAPHHGAASGTPPNFVWEPVAGAAYYELTYANNAAFTNPTKSATMSSSLTPVKDLATGRYYWFVQMFDQDKRGGPIIARYFDLGYGVYLPYVAKIDPPPSVDALVFDYYRATGCTDKATPAGVAPQRARAPVTGIGVKLQIRYAQDRTLHVEAQAPGGQTPTFTAAVSRPDEEFYLVNSSVNQTGEECVAPLAPGAYTFRVYIDSVQLASGVFTIDAATAGVTDSTTLPPGQRLVLFPK